MKARSCASVCMWWTQLWQPDSMWEHFIKALTLDACLRASDQVSEHCTLTLRGGGRIHLCSSILQLCYRKCISEHQENHHQYNKNSFWINQRWSVSLFNMKICNVDLQCQSNRRSFIFNVFCWAEFQQYEWSQQSVIVQANIYWQLVDASKQLTRLGCF